MFTWIDHAFWAVETLGFACVFALIVRSRSSLRWYSLAIYSFAQVGVNSVLAAMYACESWKAYFYTQWPSEILLCFVKLAILWQLIIEATSSPRMVPKAIRRWFLASVIAIGAAAWSFGFNWNISWLEGASKNDLPAM